MTTRDALLAAFNLDSIKSTINSCLLEIPQVYKAGAQTDDALKRIKALNAVFKASGVFASPTTISTTFKDMVEVLKGIEDYFAEYHEDLKTDAEDKLNYMLLDGMVSLTNAAEEASHGLPWKKKALGDALFCGISWQARTQILEPPKHFVDSMDESGIERDEKHEATRKVRLQRIMQRWFKLFKRILDASKLGIESRCARRLFSTVADCISDTLAYSDDNAKDFLQGKADITSKDLGRWSYGSPSFLVVKSLLGTLVTLNLQVKNPKAWAEQVFDQKVWGFYGANSCKGLFGKRIATFEDGLSGAIDVLLAARPQQFRRFPLGTVKHNGVPQEPGTITGLLIDGKSMTWQTATKNPNGTMTKNTVPFDVYFANGKSIRIEDNGMLSVTVQQDDTSISIGASPLKVQMELNVPGVAEIVQLLEARHAKIRPGLKQSLPRQSANVSIKSPSTTGLPDKTPVGEHSPDKDQHEKKTASSNQGSKGVKTTGLDIDRISRETASRTERDQPNTFPQESRNKRPLPVPSRKNKGSTKASKPEHDIVPDSQLNSIDQASIPANATKSVKPNVTVGHDSRTAPSGEQAVSRESTGSLSSIPPDDGKETVAKGAQDNTTAAHVHSPNSRPPDEPENDLTASTARKTQRTYAKAQGTKKATKGKERKQQREETEDEESESRSVGSKRSIEAATGPEPEAKKSRKVPPTSNNSDRPTTTRLTKAKQNSECICFPKSYGSDADEPESATLPKVNTQAIMDTYDNRKPGKATSKANAKVKQDGKQKLRVQDQMPQVQDDVFYDHPPTSGEDMDSFVPGSGFEANGPPSAEPGVRDVRFSSPLEALRQQNIGSSQPNKSSLKKAAASKPPQVQIQSRTEVFDIQPEAGQALTIVVNPPSTEVSAPSSSMQPRDVPESVTKETLPIRSVAKTAAAASTSLGVSSNSLVNGPPDVGGTSSVNLPSTRTIRKAPIDAVLSADLEGFENRNAGPVKEAVKHDTHSAKDPVAMVVTVTKRLATKHTRQDVEEELYEAARPEKSLKSSRNVKVPVAVPHRERGREADPQEHSRNNRKRSRSKASTEIEDRAPPSKKRRHKREDPATAHTAAQSRHSTAKKTSKAALAAGLPEDSDEEELTEEALSMRELILEVYRVTWKEAKGKMQGPVAECSAAQERLKALVLKLLQDLFTETNDLVELWQTNQERCYEAVTSKILPALKRLEEENDRVYATMRQVSDYWEAGRIRVPENILAWNGD